MTKCALFLNKPAGGAQPQLVGFEQQQPQAPAAREVAKVSR